LENPKEFAGETLADSQDALHIRSMKFFDKYLQKEEGDDDGDDDENDKSNDDDDK
jgi:hypothetical protein